MKNKYNAAKSHRCEELVKRGQVAKIFNVSERTIGRWEKEGKITPIIINPRVYRYRLSDIDFSRF